MLITSANGAQVPFHEVAKIINTKSPSVISRLDRRRIVNITADVNKDSINMEAFNRAMTEYLDQLVGPLTDVSYEFWWRSQRTTGNPLVLYFMA